MECKSWNGSWRPFNPTHCSVPATATISVLLIQTSRQQSFQLQMHIQKYQASKHMQGCNRYSTSKEYRKNGAASGMFWLCKIKPTPHTLNFDGHLAKNYFLYIMTTVIAASFQTLLSLAAGEIGSCALDQARNSLPRLWHQSLGSEFLPSLLQKTMTVLCFAQTHLINEFCLAWKPS